MEHFNFDDLIIRKDRCVLRKNTVPITNTEITAVFDTVAECNSNADIVEIADVPCEGCQILNEELSAVQNQCAILEKEKRSDRENFKKLLEKYKALEDQLQQSKLARFALKTYVDENVGFEKILYKMTL